MTWHNLSIVRNFLFTVLISSKIGNKHFGVSQGIYCKLMNKHAITLVSHLKTRNCQIYNVNKFKEVRWNSGITSEICKAKMELSECYSV